MYSTHSFSFDDEWEAVQSQAFRGQDFEIAFPLHLLSIMIMWAQIQGQGSGLLTDWLVMKSCRKIPALCPIRYLIPVRLCLQNKDANAIVRLLKSTAHGRSQQDSSTTILVFLSKRSPAIPKMLSLPFWDCLESTQHWELVCVLYWVLLGLCGRAHTYGGTVSLGRTSTLVNS